MQHLFVGGHALLDALTVSRRTEANWVQLLGGGFALGPRRSR
jgi:hypothetical protein